MGQARSKECAQKVSSVPVVRSLSVHDTLLLDISGRSNKRVSWEYAFYPYVPVRVLWLRVTRRLLRQFLLGLPPTAFQAQRFFPAALASYSA